METRVLRQTASADEMFANNVSAVAQTVARKSDLPLTSGTYVLTLLLCLAVRSPTANY